MLYRSVSPDTGISAAVIVICAKLDKAKQEAAIESIIFFMSI
jgi:hypothetical protein